MQQLFFPRDASKSLGGTLHNMQRQGRAIIEQEKQRYQRNREIYRGNSLQSPAGRELSAGSINASSIVRTNRKRDKVNRMRQFVEGHVSMMTSKMPPYEVLPKDHERQSVDGARLATKFVRAEWRNPSGWNVAKFSRTLVRQGAIDGVAFANVMYDKSKGKEVRIPFQLTPQGPKPFENVSDLEAAKTQDPTGGTLWQEVPHKTGRIVFRVVKAGYMSVDPTVNDDWNECRWVCESRTRPLAELEEMSGRNLQEELKKMSGRTTQSGGSRSTTYYDDEPKREQDLLDGVLVHDMYIKPQGQTSEWPLGAHIMWIDPIPENPIIMEPWLTPEGTPRDLPYRPYVPRPDGGNIFRTMSLVDDLAPVQIRIDRTFAQVGDWADLVARPPLLVNGGSLRTNSVFNEDRLVVTNPGFSEPRFMNVPTEPASLLTNFIPMLEQEMAELSSQLDPVRGAAPGHGVDAAVSINMLIEQAELMNSAAAEEFKTTLEWAVSEALKNVVWFWSVPELIAAPGVDDESEFQAFKGEKLRGATDFRITGSVLPKQRSAQIEMLRAFMQYAGERFDPTPYFADIIEGDVESMVDDSRRHEQKQARENRRFAALGTHPDRDEIWTQFVQMRDAYVKALNELSGSMASITDPAEAMYVQQLVGWMQGQKPKITDLLVQVGVDVPQPGPLDRDHEHIAELERFAVSDGFEGMHDIVKQLTIEHFEAHKERRASAYGAMGAQNPIDPMAKVQAAQADQQAQLQAESNAMQQQGETDGGTGAEG